MNANARKWVEALRSGEFEQGKGALREGDRYCCLGVACELFSREANYAWWIVSGDKMATFRTDGSDGYDTAELPPSVRDWLGLRYKDAAYGEDLADCLAADNDNGATFAQIADTIESQPRGLFKEGVK